MAEKFLYPYTVNADFIDSRLRFTLIGMISLAQTAVSFHYGENRLSIPHMVAKGKTWVVSKQHFEISEYPVWQDEFLSSSWLERPKGPFCYYDFDFSYFDGGKKKDLNEKVRHFPVTTPAAHSFCQANSMWLLLDLKNLRPTKADGEDFADFDFCDQQLFPNKFPRLELAEKWDREEEFSPLPLEIDLNGHVNNVEYVKYILNYLPQDAVKGMLVKTLDTNYISSAHESDTLICKSAILDCQGDEKTLIHQIVRKDGSEVFRARTVWAPEEKMSRDVRV